MELAPQPCHRKRITSLPRALPLFALRLGLLWLGAFVGALTAAPAARANPEPPASHDARIAGLGGVAAATVESSAAIVHNPAQLESVGRFAATASVTSLFVNLRAPFAGPGSERDSGVIYAPLPFLGAALRLHDRVVLGVGAYAFTGFGGGYSGVDCISYGELDACGDAEHPGRFEMPRREEVTLYVGEVAAAAQVTLVPEVLSVGVSLRLPWARQDVRATQEFSRVFTQADQSLRGVGIPGVLVGVSARPTRNLTLALAYRSKVFIDLEGETVVPPLAEGGDAITVPTTSRWNVPHMIRAGASYRFGGGRAMVATELRLQLHREANAVQRFELSPEQPLLANLIPDTEARFDWRNVLLGGVAGELWVTPRVPLRAGFTVANSASRRSTMTPFSPPFGVQFGALLGTGVRAGPVDIDAAFGWGGNGRAERIRENGALCSDSTERYDGGQNQLIASAGCAGRYNVYTWFFSLSATFRLQPRAHADAASTAG